MEPAIDVGSLAVVKPVDPSTIREGDIIAYTPPTDTSIVVTHRVIEVVPGEKSLMFRTKGDANDSPDTYTVPEENVGGKIWTSIPYAGYAMDYMKKPLGFWLLMGIPAVIIILIELKNIFSVLRDRGHKGSLVAK